MNGIKTGNDRERLAAVYGEMGDGELLELQATAGDLTEVAQEALAGEMRRRGLAVEKAAPVGESNGDGGSGWKTLHVFSQTFEAQATFKLLEREGIEFAVEDRTVDEKGEVRAGPAVQLALMVEGQEWERGDSAAPGGGAVSGGGGRPERRGGERNGGDRDRGRVRG